MSGKCDDGGPAFPLPSYDWNTHGGMSLRDWFAGQAMAGILANPEALRASPPLKHAERAEAAYKAADAMIAERNK